MGNRFNALGASAALAGTENLVTAGVAAAADTLTTPNQLVTYVTGAARTWSGNQTLGTGFNLALSTTGIIQWGSDVSLVREAADILAQRDGVNQQSFRVYNTYTDASNYERLTLHCNGNNLDIVTEAAGTGAARNLRLWAATGSYIAFITGGGVRWEVDSSGNLICGSDSAFDVGASGATRPRDLYLGRNFVMDTTTGNQLGTATTQKIGVYGATPIAQRSGAAQAAVVTTGSALASYGYTQAQADSIVTLLNELRAWAVAQGWIKGSA